jgi:hypothetical protein
MVYDYRKINKEQILMKDILDEIRYQYYNRTMLKSKICLMVGMVALVVYSCNRSKSSVFIIVCALILLLIFPLYFSVVEKRIRKNSIYDIARRVYKIYDDRDQRYILLKNVLSYYELIELKALRLKLKAEQGKGFMENMNASIPTCLTCMAILISLIPDNAKPEDFLDFKVFVLYIIFGVAALYLIVGLVHDNPDDYILNCIEEVLEDD